MKMTLKNSLTTLFSILQLLCISQTTGTIRGTILDENKKPMFTAVVKLYADSIYMDGTSSKEDGIYTFRSINPGTYNVHISMMGYQTQIIKSINVSSGQTADVNANMELFTNDIKGVVITAYEKPIIDKEFGLIDYISLDDIKKSAVPHNDAIQLAAQTPGVTPTNDGKDLYVRGSRSGTTSYIVDGMKTIGDFNVAASAIAGMVVVPGGIPAEFGDLTGGVVIITTMDYLTAMRQKRMMYDEYNEEEEYKKNFLTKASSEEKKDESTNELKKNQEK